MKIITVETLKMFLDELNRKYGTEFYSKTECDERYQPKGDYATRADLSNIDLSLYAKKADLTAKAEANSVYTKEETDRAIKTAIDSIKNGNEVSY